MKKQILRTFAAVLAVMLLAGALSLSIFATSIEEGYPSVSEEFVFENGETITAAGTYSLFNSGLPTGYIGTNMTGRLYSDARNPAETTYTNEGYDIYIRANTDSYDCASSAQLGLSFYVDSTITEKVQLSVYAYDVDESDGEWDNIYLVDETTGNSQLIGNLSGMNEEWNNSTFDMDPALFEKGHTYHYQIVGENDTWCVYVRTVSMNVMATSVQAPQDGSIEAPVVTNISSSVSISSDGEVVANINVYSSEPKTFEVEWKATHAVTNNQVASFFCTVEASPEGATHTFNFWLDGWADVGTYRLDAYVKEVGTNNVVQSVTTVAGYVSLAVAYNANGGTQNLPLDYTAYYEGDEVVVLFDYVPSKAGYVFLGWATSENAVAPEFVNGQDVRLNMSDSDVTLFAVWREERTNEPEFDSATEYESAIITDLESVEEIESLFETEPEVDYKEDQMTKPEVDDAHDDDYDDQLSVSDVLYEMLVGCVGSVSAAMALPLVGVAGVLMLRKGRKKD